MSTNRHKKQPLQSETLRKAFRDPSIYAHEPNKIEEKQTHASYVFIARPWVYKIKKPVNFGFLDYATLEKRRYYCFREVALNRRLCPDIYEGVIPIFKAGESLKLGIPVDEEDDTSEALEYAVKMKYLPEEYFLKQKIEREEVTTAEMERVAQKLFYFYSAQCVDQTILKWGEIDRIKISTDENFEQTESFAESLLPKLYFRLIKEFTNSFFTQNRSLFEVRISDNRIVDGHGDLHLDHIHITGDRVCIYDCIEFNDRLRYQDLANDIAFLAMDLDFNQRPDLRRHFIHQISTLLDDKKLLRLMDFYKCYRAYVRGKVEGLTLQQEDLSDSSYHQTQKQAQKYFNLSAQYAIIGSRPIAIIFMGRIGTGKSTLSKKLAATFNIPRYSSDLIRKHLAGLPPAEASPQELHAYLYSREMSEETYKTIYQKSLKELENSNPVLLDATFSRKEKRTDLTNRLRKAGYPYIFVQTRASDSAIKVRLKRRDNSEEVISDARLENFDSLNAIFEPPEELENSELITVSTEQSIERSFEKLLREIMHHHLRVLKAGSTEGDRVKG